MKNLGGEEDMIYKKGNDEYRTVTMYASGTFPIL
jgi:hypothetical protein